MKMKVEFSNINYSVLKIIDNGEPFYEVGIGNDADLNYSSNFTFSGNLIDEGFHIIQFEVKELELSAISTIRL